MARFEIINVSNYQKGEAKEMTLIGLLTLIFLSSFQGSSAKGILEELNDNNNEGIGETEKKNPTRTEDFARPHQKGFAEFFLTDPDVGRFDRSKPYQMTKLVDMTCGYAAADDSNTVKSILFNPEVRNKRGFHDERLTQILHQLCCQVFYYLRHKGSVRIEEVQSLSVFDCSGILQYIFFAVNAIENRNRFSQLKKLWKTDFQVIITTPYSDKNMNPSEKRRSLRNANKLKDQLYSPKSNTDKEWSKVDDIRRFVNRHGKYLKTHNSVSKFQDTQGIFLLDLLEKKRGSSLHAEQQLCDLLNINQVEVKDCTLQITGKRRPCMACCGRMIYENGKFQLIYNERPGFLWKNHFGKQDVEMRKKTAELYADKPCNISINHEGRTDRSVATGNERSYDFVEDTIPQIENAERLQMILADVPVTENVRNLPEEKIVATVTNGSNGKVLNDTEEVKQEELQGDFDNKYDADCSSESETDSGKTRGHSFMASNPIEETFLPKYFLETVPTVF